MKDHIELLAYVARADGTVSLEEALAIRGFMSSAGMTPEVVARMNELLSPNTELHLEDALAPLVEHASPWMLAEAIRDAYLIALVDGELVATEIRVIEKLLDLLLVPGELRGELHRWARDAGVQQLRGMAIMTRTLEKAKEIGAVTSDGKLILGTLRR